MITNTRKKAIAKKARQDKYEAKCRHFMLRLRLDTDADIISWLKEQESANAKLKELIRNEINV